MKVLSLRWFVLVSLALTLTLGCSQDRRGGGAGDGSAGAVSGGADPECQALCDQIAESCPDSFFNADCVSNCGVLKGMAESFACVQAWAGAGSCDDAEGQACLPGGEGDSTGGGDNTNGGGDNEGGGGEAGGGETAGDAGGGSGTGEECSGRDLECGLCGWGEFSQPLGGACGWTTRCHPDVLSAEDFQACLKDQCNSQQCGGTFCEKSCRSDRDCESAVDGPVGDVFRCSPTGTNGTGTCMPGSLELCSSDADCVEDNEVCSIGFSANGDSYVGYCQTRVKCGVAAGESCNPDPLEPPVVRCENQFCTTGGRCLKLCSEDSDCADSVATECRDVGELTICAGKSCTLDGDCEDETYWCALNLSEDGFSWDNRCVVEDEGDEFAPLGEFCNTNEQSGPVIECAKGMCSSLTWNFDNRCSNLCQTDADCGENFRCLDQVTGVEANPERTRWIRFMEYGLCTYAPGSFAECTSDNQCQPGEACSPVFNAGLADEEGTELEYEVTGRCRTHNDDARPAGEPCNGQANTLSLDENCQGLICDSGKCTTMCGSSDDCGGDLKCRNIAFSDGSGFEQSFCLSWRGSGTPCSVDADADGFPESFTDCEDGEVCRPNAIAANGSVEYFCGTSTGEEPLGSECASGEVCESGMCQIGLEDGARRGYCSAICVADADCPNGWTCTNTMYVDADGPRPPARGFICRPPLECQPCHEYAGCPSGFGCSYFDLPNADPNAPVERAGVCMMECANASGEPADGMCDDTSMRGRVDCSEAKDRDGVVHGTVVCNPRDPWTACGFQVP